MPAIYSRDRPLCKSSNCLLIGGSTDAVLDIALKRWDLQTGRDVVVLQTGGMPESVAALSTGAIDAAVLSPPSNIRAPKLGGYGN